MMFRSALTSLEKFSQTKHLQASTPGYGPDDFIVETVNLDKDFFYQFFTSKPMIIDTDVVTSTSVQVSLLHPGGLGSGHISRLNTTRS